MPGDWKVIYYEDEHSRSEVYDFIENQSERNQAKLLGWVEQLEKRGPTLPRPYADLLQDGIHELRIKLSGNQARILYFFCYKEFVVLTNVFAKTTDRVPEREISKAKERRELFLLRFNEKTLRRLYDEDV